MLLINGVNVEPNVVVVYGGLVRGEWWLGRWGNVGRV